MKFRIVFIYVITVITIFFSSNLIYSQNVWVQIADNPIAIESSIAFSINGKGYVGLGDLGSTTSSAIYEYDPTSNTWTLKTNYPGGNLSARSIAFTIGNKAYIGTGYNPSTMSLSDQLWEYDPATNSWSQKASFPGGVREGACAFSIGNKGYVGTGWNTNYYDDFWEFDPASNNWTQKADFIGGPRALAAGFSINGMGYIATGYYSASGGQLKTVFQYNPTTNSWSQKADYDDYPVYGSGAFVINNKAYLCSGLDSTLLNTTDMLSYDPLTDSWSHEIDFPGLPREECVAFSIGNSGYVGWGYHRNTGLKSDFWKYTVQINSPDVQAYRINITNISQTSARISWLRGNGGHCAAFLTQMPNTISSPLDSTIYLADSVFLSGSQIGSSMWYCIYNGTDTMVNVTNLSADTQYQVFVYEYNGLNGNEKYNILPAVNNPETFITQKTSIDDITQDNTFQISYEYSYTKFVILKPYTNISLQLFNSLGSIIYSQQNKQGNKNTWYFNNDRFPSGIYYISVKMDDQLFNHKIFIL